MSSMLEQAIIDAAALKDAALKNAETLVLEKYSSQIKEAVESLLEQDSPLAAAPMDAMPTETPEAMPEMPDAPLTPPAADTASPVPDATQDVPSPVMEHIPLAATSKDDDQVEIPLDQLMEELAILNESFRFDGDSHNDPELYEHNILEAEADTLEELLADLHEEEGQDQDGEEEPKSAFDGEGPGTGTTQEDPVIGEGDVDLEEQIMAKIAEQLTVDLGEASTKSGWAGTPSTILELAEEEILALEKDSEQREHRAAINKAVKEIDKVNESLTQQNTKLHESLDDAKTHVVKLRDTVLFLKDKLEESNLNNAKLLYQNKALISSSLNERQKQKLVEAISNADSVEEAKVIFDTLHSTVGSTSRKKQPKSLGEAVEKSSSMIMTARKERRRQKKDPTLQRWRFLAGIDKK